MFEQQSDSEDTSTFVDIYKEDSIFDLYLSSGSETLNGSKEKLLSGKNVKEFYKSTNHSALKNCKNCSQKFDALYHNSNGGRTGEYKPYNETIEGKYCKHKEDFKSNYQKFSDKRKRKNGGFKTNVSIFSEEHKQQSHEGRRGGGAKRSELLEKSTFEKVKTYFHFNHWKRKKDGIYAPKLERQGAKVSGFMSRDDSSSYYNDDSTSDDGAEPLDKRILQEEHKRVVQSYRRLVLEPNSRIEAYGYI
jgi:hypothetical protein